MQPADRLRLNSQPDVAMDTQNREINSTGPLRSKRRSNAQHTLGSPGRWVETMVWLAAPTVIVHIGLCLFIHSDGNTWTVSVIFAISALIVYCAAAYLFGTSPPALQIHASWPILMDSLAFGWADEEGIHFRKWFRWHVTPWKAIVRLEYWPDRGGQIDLHLASQPDPVTFLPAPQSTEPAEKAAESVGFIAERLERAWPGKSAFVVSMSPPDEKLSFIAKLTRRFSPRQKATTHAVLMMFLSIAFYVFTTLYLKVRYHSRLW